MPEEKTRDQGRYLVRFPEGMRERLAAEAEANKRSMNAEIIARLEESFGRRSGDDLELSPAQQRVFDAMQETIKETMREMISRWDVSRDRYPGGSLGKEPGGEG